MSSDSVNGTGATKWFDLMPKATEQKKELGQDDFLRLMIAQVQNQDPMDPKTNGDFMAQMAQFSTTDGIGKMQKSLANLAGSLQSAHALQATALVGKKVMVNSDKFALPEEGETQAMVQVPSGITDMKATIYNDKGEIVRQISLGSTSEAEMAINWDGMDNSGVRQKAGTYRIAVTGSYLGKGVALNTMTKASVDSVSIGQNGEGVRLNIAGIGSVSLDDVREITS
ncbi:flagellar hook assembly protein FlgD [Legionella sp. W05-934-2]|uniref:flagellar hook assembly protein FlgD n=1 Tax=Legionella sp. W05-934-2 TaxID=1198649 RepID=UPI00346231DB